MLASGSDPNVHGATWTWPLQAAAERPHNSEVIRTLLSAGANPNPDGVEDYEGGDSPLYRAVVIEDVDNARALLEAGASVKSYQLTNTAHLNAEVMKLLVAHGLDELQVDKDGRNLLHQMLQWDPGPQPELVDYLIQAGVPLNARDADGKTPLSYWREPRNFELHPFWCGLTDCLVNNETVPEQQGIRMKISALLERSGARL
jgi:ankyrin repeat protein